MQLNHRHDWNVTAQQAIALQKTLAAGVVSNRPIDLAYVSLVAGVDVSVKDNVSQAAVVISTFPDCNLLKLCWRSSKHPFPTFPVCSVSVRASVGGSL